MNTALANYNKKLSETKKVEDKNVDTEKEEQLQQDKNSYNKNSSTISLSAVTADEDDVNTAASKAGELDESDDT